MQNLLSQLIQSTLLVIGFVFVISLYLDRISHLSTPAFGLVVGVSFGLFGILILLFTVEISPGVVIDVRSPFIIIAGFMGGLPGVLTASGIMALWRFFVVGGVGAVPGTLAILGNIPLGYAAYRWRGRRQHLRLFGLGITSVLVSVVVAYIFLPRAAFNVFMPDFLPSALVLYPTTTLFLGMLVMREQRNIQLNEELRQSEARFRAIFNQTFQFIGLLKPDGTLIEANDTALSFAGIQQADAIGKPFWEARWWSNSAESQHQLREAIQRARCGEFVRYRVDVQGQGDTTLTIDFSLTPIKDKDGKVTVIIPEGRDISSEILAEARRVELALERERAELTQRFIQDASHHLRTPITVLGTSEYLGRKVLAEIEKTLAAIDQANTDGNATQIREALAKGKMLTEKLQKRMDTCNTGIHDISKVIEELLQLSRLDGMADYETTHFDLTTLLTEEIEPYMLIVQREGKTLTHTVPKTACPIHADPQNMRIVLQNLIENAIHYTDQHGTIHVTLSNTPGGYTIQVADNGIGILPEHIDKIFSRFYRADNAATKRPRGSGLGLAIVKSICEQENGTITVQSQVGQGTTFTVILPAVASANPATASSHTPSPSTSSVTPPPPTAD